MSNKSDTSNPNWERWPDVVRLREEGKTWRQIAEICNVKKECLRVNARKRGINTRGTKQKDVEGINWADVWQRRQVGETWASIAAGCGADEITLMEQAAATGKKATDRKADIIRRICDPKWPGWEYAVKMREQGETWENIANYAGVSVKLLREVMVMHGLREPPAPTNVRRIIMGNYAGGAFTPCQTLRLVPGAIGVNGSSRWTDGQPSRLYYMRVTMARVIPINHFQ